MIEVSIAPVVQGRSGQLQAGEENRMDIWKEQSETAKKERWKALWAMEDLPRPLWFIPATPVLAVATNWMFSHRSLTALFSDRDVQYEESMKFNRSFALIQKIWSRDDFVLHLQPQMGVGVFASAFGCRIKFPPDQFPWSYPAIGPNDPPEKVMEMEPPDVRAGLLGDLLDFTETFDRRSKGRYPIAMTDLQGPLDTAYLVWDSCAFMMAMYDHPEAVHRLMRMVTDLIIKFAREMKARVREFVPAHFPPVYLPDGKGICVSEDALAVISAPLWEKFSLPYLNELSEEFGGIVIHSCGNFKHQLDVIAKVRGLRGINFGVSETDFEAVWSKFGGKIAVIPHCSAERIVANFKNAKEWVAHVMAKKTTNRGLALMVYPIVGDVHKQSLNLALNRKSEMSRLELALLGRDLRRLIDPKNK